MRTNERDREIIAMRDFLNKIKYVLPLAPFVVFVFAVALALFINHELIPPYGELNAVQGIVRLILVVFPFVIASMVAVKIEAIVDKYNLY